MLQLPNCIGVPTTDKLSTSIDGLVCWQVCVMPDGWWLYSAPYVVPRTDVMPGCPSRAQEIDDSASFCRWERDAVPGWDWATETRLAAAGRRCTPATIAIVGDRRKLSTVDQRRRHGRPTHSPSPVAAAEDGKGRFRAANVVVCRRSSISHGCWCCANSTYCHRRRHNRRRQRGRIRFTKPNRNRFWFSPVV